MEQRTNLQRFLLMAVVSLVLPAEESSAPRRHVGIQSGWSPVNMKTVKEELKNPKFTSIAICDPRKTHVKFDTFAE